MMKRKGVIRGFLLFWVLSVFILAGCKKSELLSDANDILSFTIPQIWSTQLIEGNSIKITVSKNADITQLVPILEISPLAEVSPQSGVVQDFSRPVIYTVTSESGSQKSYVVEVIQISVDNKKELLGFEFPNKQYVKTVTPEGLSFDFYRYVDLTKLSPVIQVSPGATVRPASGMEIDFSHPVEFTITSEDGSDTTFMVVASNHLSSQAKIEHFSLNTPQQIVESEDNQIYVYTPYDVDLTQISAQIEISPYSTITPANGVALDFSNPVVYQVTASDGNVKDYTVTVKRSPWRCLVKNGEAPFHKVDGHRLVVYDDYMWLLGGWLGKHHEHAVDGDYWTSQVWRTKDGINWENMGDAPWTPRHGFGCVAFDGKLWVIAGDSNTDIWYTTDGHQWVQVVQYAPFSMRYFPYVSVFKDKIWLIGGQHGYWNIYEAYNDIWSSGDGVNWTLERKTGDFTARAMISGSAVLNDELYIIGGGVVGPNERSGEYNDVWKSGDGVNFRNMTREAPFRPIYWHSIGSYRDKIYVLAGMQRGDIHTNEVWYSSDGKEWLQQKYTFWEPRHATSAIEFKGKLYMIGGTTDPIPERDTHNDVWVMESEF